MNPATSRGLAACLAAAAALTTMLAACGITSSSGATAVNPGSITAKDDGAKLTLWVRAGNEAVTDAVVNAYNKTHKNHVSITHVPADQYIAKFAAAEQSGSLPDILTSDIVFQQQIIRAGAVLGLTKLLKRSGAYGHLAPAHELASTYHGEVYGVPYVTDTSLYLYNKTLFARAGLNLDQPPTTWAGILHAADAISRLGDGIKGFYISGDCSGCIAYDFTPLIWAQGQQVVTSNGSFTFDNSATQKALAFMRTLYQHGDIPATAKTDGGDGFLAEFATGKIGIDFAGGNGVETSALGKSPKFSFALAPIPGPASGQWATFSGGDTAGISRTTKHPDEAWDFIDWLSSLPTSNNVYLKLPAMPPRTDAAMPNSFGPQFVVPATLIKHGETYATPYYNDVIATAQGPWLQMFQSVVFDGATPVAATEKAQQAANSITK